MLILKVLAGWFVLAVMVMVVLCQILEADKRREGRDYERSRNNMEEK